MQAWCLRASDMNSKTEDAVQAWIPHRGAMQLLSRIVAVDESSAVAQVDVPMDGLFVRDGEVPAWIGMEYMAQTVSAWAGAREREAGSVVPKLGLLLGSRQFVARLSGYPCGSVLTVQARCELVADNGLGLFDCQIELAGKPVATARLSVFQPGNALEFIRGHAARGAPGREGQIE